MFRNLIEQSIIKVRVFRLKRKLSNKDSQIELETVSLKINIVKEKSAKFIVKGKLKFVTFMGKLDFQALLSFTWEETRLSRLMVTLLLELASRYLSVKGLL